MSHPASENAYGMTTLILILDMTANALAETLEKGLLELRARIDSKDGAALTSGVAATQDARIASGQPGTAGLHEPHSPRRYYSR